MLLKHKGSLSHRLLVNVSDKLANSFLKASQNDLILTKQDLFSQVDKKISQDQEETTEMNLS